MMENFNILPFSVLVGVLIAFVIVVYLLNKKPRKTSASVPPSPGAIVLMNLAAGNLVSRTALRAAFEDESGFVDSEKIGRVAKELEVRYLDVLTVVTMTNHSILYTGPKDKIPEKLRPALDIMSR